MNRYQLTAIQLIFQILQQVSLFGIIWPILNIKFILFSEVSI